MSKLFYAIEGSQVTVVEYRGEKWSDPEKEIVGEHVFDASQCPEVLVDGETEKSLAAYGLLKLLQDRTSQEKGAEAKVEAMQTYFLEYFSQGLWKKPAERKASTGGGGSRRKIGASLAEAIARLQGCTAIQAEAALKTLDKEQFENLVGNPKVVEMIAEVEGEAGEAIDLSDL